jgi:hypothetical protein
MARLMMKILSLTGMKDQPVDARALLCPRRVVIHITTSHLVDHILRQAHQSRIAPMTGTCRKRQTTTMTLPEGEDISVRGIMGRPETGESWTCLRVQDVCAWMVPGVVSKKSRGRDTMGSAEASFILKGMKGMEVRLAGRFLLLHLEGRSEAAMAESAMRRRAYGLKSPKI